MSFQLNHSMAADDEQHDDRQQRHYHLHTSSDHDLSSLESQLEILD